MTENTNPKNNTGTLFVYPFKIFIVETIQLENPNNKTIIPNRIFAK